MIGLQKILEVFNTNASQIANELGVSRQTVYDWIKEKRKIPEKRLSQLAHLPEFKFINKDTFQKTIEDVDIHDIQIAYINHLAEKESVVIDEAGNTSTVDPYKSERNFFLTLKENKKQMNMVEDFLTDDEFIDELRGANREIYSIILSDINHLFKRQSYEQIMALHLFLEQLLSKNGEEKSNYANEIKNVLDKYDLTKNKNNEDF
jgi:predicted DNA-binding protein YlxM (UPF0122 family)